MWAARECSRPPAIAKAPSGPPGTAIWPVQWLPHATTLPSPFTGNVKKRLVRSPKVYVRDAGILHALLEIDDFDALAGHPVYGHSWEGFPQGS